MAAEHPPVPTPPMSKQTKPVVVGLYGVAGCGKTYLLNELRSHLDASAFALYDGSDVIASVVGGDMAAFQRLDDGRKHHYRARAIQKIRDECAASGRTAVVAGHYMFWEDQEGDDGDGAAACPTVVATEADWDVYTHIVYLCVPADVAAQRRRDDQQRRRPAASEARLAQWVAAERAALQTACREHGILFCPLYPGRDGKHLLAQAQQLLRDFHVHSETHNLDEARRTLDAAMAAAAAAAAHHSPAWRTALVLDGDRTLAAQDTGTLFWAETAAAADQGRRSEDGEDPLKTLFGSRLGYSYTAFRQATLLYESEASRLGPPPAWARLCDRVAGQVQVYPEMAGLVAAAAHARTQQDHGGGVVLVVVLTCGPAAVWRRIVAPLGAHVLVVGGGRVADGFVVTPAVKAALVQHLQSAYGVPVWAFGDSPLDLPMLQQADAAVVVVGDERTRSRTMDAALARVVRPPHGPAPGPAQGPAYYQARLPPSVSPRLDTRRLPVIDLADAATVRAILGGGPVDGHDGHDGHDGGVLHVVHAGDRPAGRLLATPTRDASLAGAALRAAHQRVGWYLALEFVAPLVGLDPVAVPHVQGRTVQGHVLRGDDGARTSIVALMRGGEPMALGVSEALLPHAAFVHARTPADLTAADHVAGRQTVLLVDSVVNRGTSLVAFVQRVRSLDAHVRIIFVAGVVQAGAVAPDGYVARHVGGDDRFSLVALRLSQNKYTGTGTTDTGNRLFGTTHMK